VSLVADGVLDQSTRILDGEGGGGRGHPLAPSGTVEEVAPDVAFVPSFANVSALRTSDGLVLFDSGSTMLSEQVHTQLRSWSADPVHTIVFTHGHIDHVFGVERYDADNAAAGAPPVRVVAHEALPARFDRYRRTAGYNGTINARQFSSPGLRWPTDYRYPDETYRDALSLDVGGERIELRHALGETDDATWGWVPGRGVLFTGDLVIWASPNCGNPQKVQRYPVEWAEALREMAGVGAEVLLPGHGLPVAGADRIATFLTEGAELLESIVEQTLAAMNEGARLDEVLRRVTPPEHLLARPHLRPVYDEPEFVVRNLWRLYGGWYDGNPATLKPATEADLATELAGLAGGPGRLAARGRELAAAGDDRSLRLAGHLVELAALAAPGDVDAHAARAEVFGARASAAASTMAQGVFRWAATESREVVDGRG
jgi:alkyl sulfatase BDS1-like metallo-beta-lactamase superfamily hydrolase